MGLNFLKASFLIIAFLQPIGWGQTFKLQKPTKKSVTKDADGKVVGTVINKSGLSGCRFVIKLTDGTYLQPLSLPNDLKSHGLKISFEFEKAPGMVGVCMIGPIVKIKSAQIFTPEK